MGATQQILSAYGALSIPTSDYYDEVSADAPVAWFRLAELSGTTAANIGSVASDGTYVGGVALGQPSLCNGIDDRALNLSGVDGRVPAGGASTWSYASNFTYEALIRPTSIGSVICMMSHGYLGPCFRLNAAGQLNFLKSYSLDRGHSATPLEGGKKYHVVATVSSSGELKFYLNGAPDGTGTTAADYGSTGKIFNIGADTSSGGIFTNYFVGTIDEVAIYNTALSSARIAAHAAAADL